MLLRASRAARVLQPRIGRTVLPAPALQFIPASLSCALSTAAAAEEQPQLNITDRCAQVCVEKKERIISLCDGFAQLLSLWSRPLCCVLREQRIIQLNAKKGIDDPALQRILRLSVEPGGCSGFSYKFELEECADLDEEEDA